MKKLPKPIYCPLCRGRPELRVRTVHRVGPRYKSNTAIIPFWVCATCKVVIQLRRWSDDLRVPVVKTVRKEILT